MREKIEGDLYKVTVAAAMGDVVGAAIVRLDANPVMEQISVARSWHRQAVGRRIWDQVIAWLGENGYHNVQGQVYEGNEKARAFLESLGAEVYGKPSGPSFLRMLTYVYHL